MQSVIRTIARRKMLFMLLAMIITMSVSAPVFLKANNITGILSQVAIYGIAAVGMTFAIICGEVDLSIGSTMALSGILLVQTEPVVGLGLAIVITLIAAAAIGWINGMLVAKAKISSFVVTLGMMLILNGVSLLIQPAPTPIRIEGFLEFGSGKLIIFPYISLAFLAFIILAQIVLSKTRFGRNIYATGGRLDAAIRAGIDAYRYKEIVFLLTAITAAIGGIMLVGKLGSSSALYASDAGLTVISSLVIGGISLSGGRGDAIDAFIGIFIMGIITNAIAVFGISSFNQLWIRGLILIIVVSLDSYIRNKKKN